MKKANYDIWWDSLNQETKMYIHKQFGGGYPEGYRKKSTWNQRSKKYIIAGLALMILTMIIAIVAVAIDIETPNYLVAVVVLCSGFGGVFLFIKGFIKSIE